MNSTIELKEQCKSTAISFGGRCDVANKEMREGGGSHKKEDREETDTRVALVAIQTLPAHRLVNDGLTLKETGAHLVSLARFEAMGLRATVSL